MPNKKSAAKRARQNEKRRLHNRSKRSAMRTAMKKVRRALAEGDVQTAQQLLPQAQSTLDKAAKVNLIKAGTAQRYTSRLQKAISKAQGYEGSSQAAAGQ